MACRHGDVEAVPAENAGQGMAAQVCYNETAVDLTYLTGNPNQNGGDWYGPTDNYFGPFARCSMRKWTLPNATTWSTGRRPTDTAFVPVSVIPAPARLASRSSPAALQFNVMPEQRRPCDRNWS